MMFIHLTTDIFYHGLLHLPNLLFHDIPQELRPSTASPQGFSSVINTLMCGKCVYMLFFGPLRFFKYREADKQLLESKKSFFQFWLQPYPSFLRLGIYKVCSNHQTYNKIMLAEADLIQNAENRRAEKPLISLSLLQAKLNSQHYQSLVEWVFAVHFFCDACHPLFSPSPLIQTTNNLKLLQSTSYLARTYFDQVLAANQEPKAERSVQMMVGCLFLAIKFNEVRAVSEQLTAEVLFGLLGLAFQREEYLQIEVRIMYVLKLRFKFTTPIDFLDIFMARFPFFPNLKHLMPNFIEFACVHSFACEFTAEQLFYGCVLAAFEMKGVILGELKGNILRGLTDCWPRSQVAKGLIVEGFNAIAQ